jgi:hypothetical protein
MSKRGTRNVITSIILACSLTYAYTKIPGPSWRIIDPDNINDEGGSDESYDEESEAFQQKLLELHKRNEQLERELYKQNRIARQRQLRHEHRTLAKLSNNNDCWVQCTNPKCGKWHIVPPDIDIEQLKENKTWTCFDNFWDLSEAFCDGPIIIVTGKEAEAIEAEILKELQTIH